MAVVVNTGAGVREVALPADPPVAAAAPRRASTGSSSILRLARENVERAQQSAVARAQRARDNVASVQATAMAQAQRARENANTVSIKVRARSQPLGYATHHFIPSYHPHVLGTRRSPAGHPHGAASGKCGRGQRRRRRRWCQRRRRRGRGGRQLLWRRARRDPQGPRAPCPAPLGAQGRARGSSSVGGSCGNFFCCGYCFCCCCNSSSGGG